MVAVAMLQRAGRIAVFFLHTQACRWQKVVGCLFMCGRSVVLFWPWSFMLVTAVLLLGWSTWKVRSPSFVI